MPRVTMLLLLALTPCAVSEEFPCNALVTEALIAETEKFNSDSQAANSVECFNAMNHCSGPGSLGEAAMADGACTEAEIADCGQNSYCGNPTCVSAVKKAFHDGIHKCMSADQRTKYPLIYSKFQCEEANCCWGWEPAHESLASTRLTASIPITLAVLAGAFMGATTTFAVWHRYGRKAQNGYMNLEA
mmetsp:Transcript_157247/g.278970  ORF Transcript_157247/g.278970 Transcript_157247/m.278970 type:complete len:188 (+) Transcript_157247:82-645(+)